MLNIHYKQMDMHLRRLSSGYRINSAADDPAGLAVSERMRTQINGLKQAQRNILDGISAYQTAEGGLIEIQSMLQRMNVLAVQAANDTLDDSDRELIELEVDELKDEINRMINSCDFNAKKIFDGSDSISYLHIGANANQTVEFYNSDLSNDVLNLSNVSVSNRESAESSISILAASLNKVLKERTIIGARINRLEHSYNFAKVMEENQTAAESRIRDADFAEEMTAFLKSKILAEAAQAILIQAMRIQKDYINNLFLSVSPKRGR